MKKNKIIVLIILLIGSLALSIQSCAVSEAVASKGGSELWSQNCGRCHNAPSRSVYSNDHWEIIGTHMRMRAHLTADETRKIVEFLQTPATE